MGRDTSSHGILVDDTMSSDQRRGRLLNLSEWKRKQKERKSRRMGRRRGKRCPLNPTQLLYSLAHSSRGHLYKNKVRQSSGADGQKIPQVPPLTEELRALGSFWKIEGQSFSRMWSLVGFPCSSGWFQTHAKLGSTNWTQQVSKRKKRHQVGRRMCWRGVGGKNGGGPMVVFYCILYEILKYIEKNLFCLQFGVPVISVLPALRGFL